MQDFIFYLKLGWQHIISNDALDHQLFILVLVASFSVRNWRQILILVTAFTIGHSITLALSVLNIFTLSTKVVEILIPVTILLTAVDNIFFQKQKLRLMRINYFLALFFGLIHGLGFANTARMIISSEENLGIPLFGFNIGLEMGQIVVVTVALFISFLLSKIPNFKEKYWLFLISGIAILLSFKMIVERL